MSENSLDEVKHYGVKGMHWGVRSKKLPEKKGHLVTKDGYVPIARGYSPLKRESDRKRFGKRGVFNINSRMSKGASHDDAYWEEARLQSKAFSDAQNALALGRIFAPTIKLGSEQASRMLKDSGGRLAQTIAVKAETNRGRAATAETMGLPRKPTNGPKYAKQNRQGVHKITSI